ncbi:ion transporter [Chelatococcus sambhunathii]|uniref:Ion transporter n=1 Tax=Chelatococcus sambhunathii TaxID=363953 RepID=A0ABU1DB74_9HYPH|nr:ion transporter [Chelatococcus sambhunathii]MDR4305362.1 ion transporter [Chelatococcus sambhunathii]
MDALKRLVEHPVTERAILALVVINAVTLGLETSPSVMAAYGGPLRVLDQAILAVFVAEIAARLAVRRLAFFRDPWSVFDFLIVAIALLPATGPLQVLRALRVLRVFRLITLAPSLKRVVGALIGALPGMGSIVLLLSLVIYVFAVMATHLYGPSMPDKFGSLGISIYTLFQLVTLDGWSGEIVRPAMEMHPYAWIFFITFILVTSFTVFNLFIGVVVNAMQAEHEAEQIEKTGRPPVSLDDLMQELKRLRGEVAALKGAAAERSA